MASPIAAANAYAKLAKIANPGTTPTLGIGSESPGPSFGSLVKEALGQVAEAGRNADTQAQALATGKANMVDVVTAVTETEVAIEALVSVRDKVIQAYEEILRMPI
ncbi:MAG: flagellar hook-basal body complex protein FliE [Xanthobacteraceae bacterium]|nr:flagellar hook-basal body complex protein FliE [Xanthobacteraceae bacterium]PWB62648.1 MAG: flagellar hook-basal body complex protein FliE [Bradyrhizobiaceae bacterium]